MPDYQGRYDFGVIKLNFGGIQDKASLLTVQQTAAADIVNFDLNIGGEITRRGGTSLVHDFGSPIVFFKKFLNVGAEIFFAVTSNGKFWSADAPAGPWTDRTGSVAWTNFTNNIVGSAISNKLVICNGHDKPVLYTPGSNVQTLEDASLQTVATTSLTATTTTVDTPQRYRLIGVTPRGETKGVEVDFTGVAQLNLTPAAMNSLAWVNNNEFTAFKVLAWGDGTNNRAGESAPMVTGLWYEVAILSAATQSWDDVGGPFVGDSAGGHAYAEVTTSTAYNTPNDWNLNGQPEGCQLVGKSRDERLWAWRKNTVWSSSLSEPTNWMREDDAYVFTVIGGDDTNVVACGGLFDYTFLFSKTALFVYNGVSPVTISLVKVVNVGCVSQNSIVYAGTDIWWWSNYGPTSGSRILQGADLAVNTGYANNIQNLVFTGTNTANWGKIASAIDIVNNRIFWAVPKVGSTANDQTIVFNYAVKGFSRYEGFDYIGSCVSGNLLYVASTDGRIYQMGSGNTDNGAAINATYTTGDMDLGSYPMGKRMLWCDVLADHRQGDYTFDFQYNVDMGHYVSAQQTATPTATNGDTITQTSGTAVMHRFYTEAMGNTFRLIFSTSSATPLKLVAWRPEIRARGVRK